jgi:hypothetical protein
VRIRSFFECLNQGGFQIFRVGVHFACGNFLVGGALKTKLANAKAICRANWWPKNATSHGTRFIELTKSSFRIERWTRLIVRELSKALFRLLAFVQQAASWITGKIMRQPGNRFPSALPHASCTLRRALVQFRKSFSEADSIELIDGKHSDAALRASGTTDEPISASARSVG